MWYVLVYGIMCVALHVICIVLCGVCVLLFDMWYVSYGECWESMGYVVVIACRVLYCMIYVRCYIVCYVVHVEHRVTCCVMRGVRYVAYVGCCGLCVEWCCMSWYVSCYV